jgi:prepilin-type N-terminal cleavage/methylation domain-containing protein
MSINQKRSKKGFTLIELLVVIAIIALLLSILVPGLKKAKEVARAAVCRSNLHTLSLAWISYAGNNRELLVGADNGYRKEDWLDKTGQPSMYSANYEFTWPGTMEDLALERERAIQAGNLWSYMDNLDAYKCPSHKTKPTIEQLKMYPRVPQDERKDSYVIVGTLNGYSVWAGGKLQVYTRMSQVKSPSQKLVLTEQHDPRGVNQGSWAWQYTVEDVGQGTIYNPEPLMLWHSGGQSWAYGDGHAEIYKWKNQDTIAVAKTGLMNQAWRGPNNEDAYWIAQGMPGASK